MEKKTKIINWEKDFFVQHRTVSATKRVEFVNDRMLHIALRGNWCNIGKGKAIPLQALTGPEGSRRMRLPDLKTTGT
jgi:hypothetical protein